MIVSFSVENFRSFAAEETFSLVASNRFTGHLEDHAVPIPGSDEKVLRSAVLYGANGAGKSNLFKALSYLVATKIFCRCLPTTYRGETAAFCGFCERFLTAYRCTKEHIPL